MDGYREVVTPADAEELCRLMHGFHDSITKELHVINRSSIEQTGSMVVGPLFDARVLIQSQWSPAAVELVLTEVTSLELRSATEQWDGDVQVQEREVPSPDREVLVTFDGPNAIRARRLHYRLRADAAGPSARFGEEVPVPDAPRAAVIDPGWRQCSRCADAWQEREDVRFSACPQCRAITDLEG